MNWPSGLTAWKEYEGSRWALRADPSSGNLHPTEGYAILPEAPGLAAGVHHYVSRDHCLELRCHFESEAALAAHLPPGGFLIGLSSIHWREAWKYGERAYRYCQHDTGHVIATVRMAAAALGWSAWLLDGFGDARVATLLGLDREADRSDLAPEEAEHPDAMILVAPSSSKPELVEQAADALVELVQAGTWTGVPNELSPEHIEWEVIDIVAESARKPASFSEFPAALCTLPRLSSCETRAATIIRQRRSAVAFDAATSITAEQFYEMLDALIPRRGVAPWDTLPWSPKLHLGIFVHRVKGLAPGLYLLERAPHVHDSLKAMLGDEPLWKQPANCPAHLDFYCISETACRGTAASLSCGQAIAGDGAFSLGMLAEFQKPIASSAHWYRRLFWEAGIIGQILYLEAEAAGIRGTGIGCYFDDSFHKVFGLEGTQFQSLYHFTVGTPVEDTRIATLPAYAHLDR